jgi:hypothetical protein
MNTSWSKPGTKAIEMTVVYLNGRIDDDSVFPLFDAREPLRRYAWRFATMNWQY